MRENPEPKFHFNRIEDDLPSLPDGVHPMCIYNEDTNTWIISKGRHFGTELRLPTRVLKGTKGFWVRNGEVAWLGESGLNWALGLTPGSEPWRRRVDTNELLEYIHTPRDAVVAKPIIDGLIHEKDLFIVAGAQKTKKTTTLLDLAVALATGGPWLRWKASKQFRVLFFDAEMKRDEIDEILAESCKRRGADPAIVNEVVKILAFKESGSHLTAMDLFRIAPDIASHRADVLIADNWRSFLPSGFPEHLQSRCIRMVRAWEAIQRTIGPDVSLVLAAHAKAGAKPDADPLDAIGGHHALAGMVNGGLTIFTTDGETGRIGHHCRRHPRGSFPVRLAGRFWEPVGLDGGRRKTQYRDETVLVNNVAANKEIAADPLADAITMALKDNPGPQSLNFIKRSVQGRSQTVVDLVKSMVAHELLLQDEHGRLSLTPPT